MKFKYKATVFTFVFHILNFCYASEINEDNEKNKSFVSPSPARQKQDNLAQYIQPELFYNIYGEDLVRNKLGNFNWNVFSSGKDYEDSDYVGARTVLMKFMNDPVVNKIRDKKENDIIDENIDDPTLSTNLLKISRIQKSLDYLKKQAPLTRLQHYIDQYFKQTLGYDIVEIPETPKRDGDQLGYRVKVYKSSDITNSKFFFIKTHTYGSKKISGSSGSNTTYGSSIANVDPRELLVYKILEFYNIGCELHIFGKNLKSMYIATQSAGENFKEYQEINASYNDAIRLKENKDFSMYTSGIVQIDLIARILCLNDLNGGNYGFDNSGNIKIVDFRLPDINATTKVNDGTFEGMLEGNGLYSYSGLMEVVLKKQNPEKQVQRAYEQFTKFYNHYDEIIDKSIKEIAKSLLMLEDNKDNHLFTDPDSKNKLDYDLMIKQYSDDIKYNFKFFKQKFEKYLKINTEELN